MIPKSIIALKKIFKDFGATLMAKTCLLIMPEAAARRSHSTLPGDTLDNDIHILATTTLSESFYYVLMSISISLSIGLSSLRDMMPDSL